MLLWFWDKMPFWSPGKFLLRSYNKGSFTTDLDNRIMLNFLVNSKSSTWPLSWVVSTTCCFKPNSSRECRNFRMSTLFRFSTWMLKSPVMRHSSDVTTNFARCWDISSVNLDTLHEGVYMRQIFWIYDSVSTRHMRCAQIENSYIIAFPQLFTDLFYLWQLLLLFYDHMIHIICPFLGFNMKQSKWSTYNSHLWIICGEVACVYSLSCKLSKPWPSKLIQNRHCLWWKFCWVRYTWNNKRSKQVLILNYFNRENPIQLCFSIYHYKKPYLMNIHDHFCTITYMCKVR